MALSGQFLDIMVIIMLAVVGGLVLWLHYRLYTLKNAEKAVPNLVSSLADSLKKAHRGVFELSRLVREDGPKLEKEVFNAQQTVQDLDYMLDKAERILKRMDDAFEKMDRISTPVIAAAKAEEKSILTGQPAREINREKPAVNKTIVEKKNTTQPQPQPRQTSVTEASKRLEMEMQKTLERELLMGMNEHEKPAPKVVNNTVKNETPKRMASPMGGAMAYGQQLNVNTSDAEKDLRQALEGRL
ncbi:MAG: hypothetical protein ACI9TY_001208 [Alphaproteobacteria bacterium]|jgi:hypothetical protein